MKVRYKTIYNPNTLSTYKVPIDKNGNTIPSKRQIIQNKLNTLFEQAEKRMDKTQGNVDVLINKKTQKPSFIKVDKARDLKKILDKSSINGSKLLFDYPYNMSMLKSALKYHTYYDLKYFVNVIIIHAKLDSEGLRQAQNSFLTVYDDMQNHYAKRFLQVIKNANLQIRYLIYFMPIKYTYEHRDNVKLCHDLITDVSINTHIFPKKLCELAKSTLNSKKNSLFVIDKIYKYAVDNVTRIKSILDKDLKNDVQAYNEHKKLTQRANLLSIKLDNSFFDKNIKQSSRVLNRIKGLVRNHPEMMEVCSNYILNVNESFKNSDKKKKQVYQIASTSLMLILISLKDMETDKDNLLVSGILLDWIQGQQSIFYKFIYSKLRDKLNISNVDTKVVHNNLNILIKYIKSNFNQITQKIKKSI